MMHRNIPFFAIIANFNNGNGISLLGKKSCEPGAKPTSSPHYSDSLFHRRISEKTINL
jgi:hypothetical protein